MELGCDAISEKPMTNHEDKCRRILETIRKTGRKLRVTFNYRYSPPRTQVKDLLMSGIIGDVLSVDFHWMLNTHYGPDYFRRWHSEKRYSQGLQIHKATYISTGPLVAVRHPGHGFRHGKARVLHPSDGPPLRPGFEDPTGFGRVHVVEVEAGGALIFAPVFWP
jgi:hypothetical protein